MVISHDCGNVINDLSSDAHVTTEILPYQGVVAMKADNNLLKKGNGNSAVDA